MKHRFRNLMQQMEAAENMTRDGPVSSALLLAIQEMLGDVDRLEAEMASDDVERRQMVELVGRAGRLRRHLEALQRQVS